MNYTAGQEISGHQMEYSATGMPYATSSEIFDSHGEDVQPSHLHADVL